MEFAPGTFEMINDSSKLADEYRQAFHHSRAESSNMTPAACPGLKLLVAIANYGTANDEYLVHIIREYRSMPFNTDIVVFSNIPKRLPGAEVVVGLPTRNPRSLPFAHKKVFADQVNKYDLFIYSEDDILISEGTVRAFLKISSVLPEDELPGCLRIEHMPDGRVFYPDIHNRFHWDAQSLRRRGDHLFAFFTNEHAGCYLLTRWQLARAIKSGGFLAGPNERRYEMLETAATDPYTQCGFKKLICLSRIDDFTVHHLPNKYIGRMGIDHVDFCRQIDFLKRLDTDSHVEPALFETETKLALIPFLTYYSKSYYEPARSDILSLVPAAAKTVLSIGCGWGAAEGSLVESGRRVVSVPLDPVISACAEARGVQSVTGDFHRVRKQLAGQRFDVLLISNVLHLISSPEDVLAAFSSLLNNGGSVILIVPNRLRLSALFKSLRRNSFNSLARFGSTGVHFTSRWLISKWFNHAGLTTERILNVVRGRDRTLSVAARGLIDPLLASELVGIARKGSISMLGGWSELRPTAQRSTFSA
jgi:2-polyprenyl-3-methyl-5-hydroxy-6-metoxy-1,4-benzoquinol methylase